MKILEILGFKKAKRRMTIAEYVANREAMKEWLREGTIDMREYQIGHDKLLEQLSNKDMDTVVNDFNI